MGFMKVKLSELHDNPYRDANAYQYNEKKVTALMDHIADTSYWENVLARKKRDGTIELAYGHHRVEALRRLVAEGLEDYDEIRVNVRPETELTNEMMLKIFAQENSDEWGEEARNACMTMIQVRAHLENLLSASANKDEFLKKVGAAGALRMDDRAFTRAKNSGVGASMIAQFLGGSFSRQTVQDAMALLESDKETLELAQNLPGITIANRFQRLITKSVEGKGKNKTVEMFDDKVQKKVADEILKNQLSRAEVEKALKMKDSMPEPDPVKAIKEVVEEKKARIKKAREDTAALRPPAKDPVDKVLSVMERLLETTRRERVNLREDDIARIKAGWPLIVEVLDTEPEEIKKAEVEEEDEMPI